jgi:hypothetical protein
MVKAAKIAYKRYSPHFDRKLNVSSKLSGVISLTNIPIWISKGNSTKTTNETAAKEISGPLFNSDIPFPTSNDNHAS